MTAPAPRLTREKVLECAHHYDEGGGGLNESALFSEHYPTDILRNGELTPQELTEIARWKSPRPTRFVQSNRPISSADSPARPSRIRTR